jgi:hypothetical protein
MNEQQRLKLQEMISENNVEDQTDLIRQLKHSEIIREEVKTMLRLIEQYKGEGEDRVRHECAVECTFLFSYYTDIFNKIRKEEIDIKLLNRFLDVLKDIEDGKVNQHEGSFAVGTILKEIYVDSALKKADKLNEQGEEKKEEVIMPQVEISWKEFKDMIKSNNTSSKKKNKNKNKKHKK